MSRLYVGNLAFHTTEDSLREAFAQCGDVTDVHLVLDRITGNSRGFAFVTMGTPEAARAAIEQLNGMNLDGRSLRVDEAQESWESAVCSSLAAEEPDCGALLYIMSATAATTSITLGGGANPDGPTYLGSPPDEVADLITDTLAAAAAAMTAGEDVDCPGENCVGTSFAFTRAWDALREALTRWSPYI